MNSSGAFPLIFIAVLAGAGAEGMATPFQDSEKDRPALEELETLCLDARRQLFSGELHITSQVVIRNKKKEFEQAHVIVFDHDQIRIDTIRPEFNDDNQPVSTIRTIHARNCVHPGFQFAFRGSPGQTVPEYSATFMALEIAEPQLIFDPRLMGYIPSETLNLYPYSFLDLVGRFAGATEYKVESERDAAFLRVSTTEGGGVVRTVWISPEKGFNVVKVVWESVIHESDSSIQYTQEISSRLERFGDGDLWFPVEMRFEALREKEIIRTETSRIKVVKLNEPIDAKRFALSSMDLPIGTRVVKFEPNEKSEVSGLEAYWDGTALSDHPLSQARSSNIRTRPVSSVSRSRQALSTSAIIILLVIGVCGYAARRRSFPKRQNGLNGKE